MAAPAPPQQGFTQAQLYMWLRGLESKLNNLVREVDVIKNDFTGKHSKMKASSKSFSEELLELKHQQEQFQKKLDIIIQELKNTAGKEEIMTLKKYVELWNPLTFVTQRDIELVVDEKIKKLRSAARKVTRAKKRKTKKGK